MTIIAETRAGQIRGTTVDGLNVFRGVPFAAPPVGAARWARPAPVAPWSGVRDALAPGAASYQDDITLMPASGLTAMLEVDEAQAEDCLFLNVWTPDLTGNRPVMVWIHGGGFAIGSGSQFVYDGTHLCQRDVVLVTVNYRMGPFGFVALDRATDGAIPATGNEGLFDQIAALQWVRDNIAGFGGDPGNVTIFGESAGSMSVTALLTMPAARGLFHKAIAQSGPGHNLLSPDEANEWLAEPMLKALVNDPTDADALLRASPEALMAALPSFMRNMGTGDPELANRWARPVVDGDTLPAWPEDAIRDGAAAGIPLMAGTTRDEMSALAVSELDDATMAAMVRASLPGHGDVPGLLDAYRTARAERMARIDAPALLTAINSHRAMWVPTTRLLDAQRAHGPVYHYVFDWISPAGDGAQGSPHAVDIAFPFGTHDASEAACQFFGQGPAADALADAVMNAWAAFARDGDPSADGLGQWPAYDADARPTMMIGANAHVSHAPFEAERRAWDGIATADMRRM